MQPWIHKAKTDGIFILLPPFVILALILFCQRWLNVLENKYSFYTWLFLVVFIDVAHVYATLFKTYLVREASKERRRLLIFLPVVCLLFGIGLFLLGSKVFWVVLAYFDQNLIVKTGNQLLLSVQFNEILGKSKF